MYNFDDMFQYTAQHIDCVIVLRGYHAVFLFNFDFYLFYDWLAHDMQTHALLAKIKCRVFDTSVTVKASGPLV